MIYINSLHRPIRTRQNVRFEGRLYVMYVYGTSTVPVNLMLTIFPILGRHRLVKFPAQGRQFYVKSRWYGRAPQGKTIDKP